MKITNYFLSSSLYLFLFITISILFSNNNVLLASDLITKRIIIPGETAEVNKPFKPKFEICNINIFDALANEWHVVVKIMDKNEIVVFSETVSGVFLAKGSSSNPSCVTRETSNTFTPSTTGTHTISVDVNYSEDINTGNDEMNKQFSVVEAPSYSISGNVLEEVNYGGNLGSYTGTPRPNVIMELYGSGGSLISITATADNGSYSFTDLTAGNYTVRATNYSVTSSRPINGGAEGNPIPVQTYRTDASSGSPVDVNNKVGGEVPSKVDADLNNGGQNLSTLTTSSTTPQSMTLVKLTDHDISGINFVFNFSTIVNTNSEGQGSLRQFIINSNILSNNGLAQSGKTAGIESSIFMIPSSSDPLSRPADPNFDGKVFKISPTSEYSPFVDKVKLDGFIQTSLTGNTNPDRPEILLDGASAGETSNGVSFLISDCRLTGMTIQKFGGNGIFCNSKIYLGTVNQSDKSVECLNNGFHGIQSKSADYVGDAFLGLENNGGDGIRIETDLDVDGIITQKNGGWGVHFGKVFRIRRVIGQRAYFWENGLGGISGVNGILSGSYFDCDNNGHSASGDNANEGHGIIVKDAFLTGVSSTENKKDGIHAETIRHREINGLEKLTVMDNGGYGIKVKGTMTADGVFVQDNGEWGILSESGSVYILKDSKNTRNYIWRNAKGGVSVKSGTFKGKFMDFYKNGHGSSSSDEGYGIIAKHVIVNGIEVSESKNDGIRSESISHTRISGQENLLSIRNGGDGLNVKGNIKADGIFVTRNMGWGANSEKGSIIIKLKKSRNHASYNKLGGLSAVNGSVQCNWLFNSDNGEMAQTISEGHGIIAGRVTVQEFGNGGNKGDGIQGHVVNVTSGFSITDNEGYGIIGSIVRVRGIEIKRNKKGGIKLLRNIKRSEALAKLNSINEENETNTVDIENSTISDNEGYGIDVGYFKNSFIEKNNIMRNTGFDLYSNVGTLEANNNWWGENSLPSKINDFISIDNWLADSLSLSISTESESFLTTSGNVDSLYFSVNNSSNLNDSLSIVVTDSLGWIDDFTYNKKINDSTSTDGSINFTVPNSDEQQNKISITATSLVSGSEDSKTILVTSYIPVYSSLKILEDSLTVSFGDTINFSAVKIDQNKNEALSQPSWNSSSGLVDNSGMFISDSTARVVELIAEDIESGLLQNTHINITNEQQVLSEIKLSPSIVTILPGDVFEFSVATKNQFDFPMEYPVTWDATGGTIDVNGLFIAGENSGDYEITVSDSTGTIVTASIINILVGVEYVDEKLPQNISLSQNYPNPFNPRTTINFSIHEESFVSLKVYNILGKEIELLVSENKLPGFYNIEFRSDALSSGIYFYKLEVGDFIETKKMIFLK